MHDTDSIRALKPEIIQRFAASCDKRAAMQSAVLVAAIVGLWALIGWGASRSLWAVAAAIPVMSLLLLRVFALMHECGHGSLFRSRRLNRALGFSFGVLAGMPQYVWSRHHNYHHATNGDWERYRGPLTSLSLEEYRALSPAARWRYRHVRRPALAPLGGFIYLIFNPRYTWMRGTLQLWRHLLRRTPGEPGASLSQRAASFQTRYWASRTEYWQMFWNNLVLLLLWAFMCWALGPKLFFTVYLISLSIAGGMGLVLFTVQHNFENSYAADTASWDADRGAIEGTSCLVLPAWLHWCTANIAYHHVHHLSASIPNYRLVEAHRAFEAQFAQVRRIALRELPAALDCLLWDRGAQRIVSLKEYDAFLTLNGQ